MDYQATLYNPIYTALGVPAHIEPSSTADPADVTALDKTAGIAVTMSGGLELETIVPAAVVRMVELATVGLTREDLDDGTIALNGKTWRIKATRPRPSPKGEADGELLLLLTEA